MRVTILKAAAFLAGFFGLLWLGVLYGETHTPLILAAVIDYVAVWQFLCAEAVADGLTRHYHNTLLANLLPSYKLTVSAKFVRGMALMFFAVSVAVLSVL